MEAAEYWYRSSDGLKLFSRVFAGPSPSSPTVLCLHGLLRNSRDFEELAPHLATRFRVVVPDIRGRGLSDRDANSGNYRLPVYIADLLQLLSGLAAPRVAVIGTSMGGLIAMLMATTHSGLVSRIVLNDVGPEIDPTGLERIRNYAGRSVPVHTWEEAIMQLRGIFGAAWPGLTQERWQQLVRRAYRTDTNGLVRADADPAIGDVIRSTSGAAPDLWPLWKTLSNTPILVLRGALSDVLSEKTAARMQQEKPDLTTLIVPSRGHVPLLDEPEVLSAIDTFLAD
jgi:pimeloyl-ACP methyl ester carboxylesterase